MRQENYTVIYRIALYATKLCLRHGIGMTVQESKRTLELDSDFGGMGCLT
jgi:hypothetical protein